MSEQLHSPELQPQVETIFPLDIDALEARLKVFEASSETMLQFVTTVRGKWGPATDLYTNMPFDRLVEWHVNEQDFSERASTYYRTGLLYGMDVAQLAHTRRFPQEDSLAAGNVAAFDGALTYLEHTYSGLDDAYEKPGWQHQKERELRYTGSDLLTIAAATQQDLLRSRLGTEENRDADTVALHVGMVDGALFIDAYRAFGRGLQPKAFDQPRSYAPTFDRRKHVAVDIIDGKALFQMDGAEDLAGILEGIENHSRHIVKKLGNVVLHASTISRMVQFGPNEFSTMGEIQKIGIEKPSIRRRGSLALVAYYTGDVAYNAFVNGPAAFLPLVAATYLGASKTGDVVNKKQAQRYAAKIGVEFDPHYPPSNDEQTLRVLLASTRASLRSVWK